MNHRHIVSLIIFSIILPVFLLSAEIKTTQSGKSLVDLYTYDQIDKMLRLKIKPRSDRTNLVMFSKETLNGLKLPSSYDWREKDIMTPVKSQGTCGGCWAFAAVGMFELSIKKTLGIIVDLSEQQVIDCAEGSCYLGGWPADALEYMKISGVVLEEEDPFKGRDDNCDVSTPSSYYLYDYREIDVDPKKISMADRILSIKNAIYNYGPVVVGVEVNYYFKHYRGGVITNNYGYDIPNHAVVLVGWKDDSTIPNGGYWILRNSWSPHWGEDGYGRIAYNILCVDSSGCWYCIDAISNKPPVFEYVFGAQTYKEGTTISIETLAIDPEGLAVHYTAAGLPQGAILNRNTGILNWTPDYTQAGTYTITIYASDDLAEVSQPLTLIIQNVKTIKK
jgi:C1A family cysteine protease